MLSPTSRGGGGPDHRELLLAPQAHVAFLRGDLEFAEFADGGHELVMDGPQAGLLVGVDAVQHRVGGLPLRGALSVGRERQVHQGVGVAVTQTEFAHRVSSEFGVLRQAAREERLLELSHCPAGLGLNVLELRLAGLVQAAHVVFPLSAVVLRAAVSI